MRKLEEVREECMQCRDCALCEKRTHVVFGTGCPTANVMFIGEGPGEQEDLTGEPFVGRAGKLLDLMLDAIGLTRENDIYIANVIKCRPPQNRDPLPEEMEPCSKWLNEQIEIIDPKIIVCLGRFAAGRLIDPDIRITRDHGQFTEKNGRVMMATLHPSALLRNPRQKPEAFADFLKLRDYLKKHGQD